MSINRPFRLVILWRQKRVAKCCSYGPLLYSAYTKRIVKEHHHDQDTSPDTASYADTISLESPLQTTNILKDAKVFIDEEGNREVESLLSDPSRFKTFAEEKIDLGYTTKEVWVRFTLKNDTSDVLRPVLEIHKRIG